MNRFHRWYCSSARWSSTVQRSLMPWILGDADLGDDVLEVGPGPGLTTDVLRARVQRLTSLEIDGELAGRLARRLQGTNVSVVEGDGTAMPFEDARFSAAVCCTMLHHVSSSELQDHLLAEVRRVLRPGAFLLGSDSRPSLLFRVAHLSDTMVLVDPETFAERLRRAGFAEAHVSRAPTAFKFRAVRPA